MEVAMSRASVSESIFKELKDAQVKYFEVSLYKEEVEKLDFNYLKKTAEKYGIVLWSFHLPFMPFAEIDISNPEIAEKTVEYLKYFIENGAKIGIDKFVIHASGEPIAENDREIRMQTAKKSLKELADFADKYGAVIAVENLPRTCLGRDSSDILELLSADKRLKSCFDTNHLLSEDALKYIKAVGKTIITTHVSDYDFKDERHWLPGEGKIDWGAIYSALKDEGYDSAWLYELNLGSTGTIERDKNLTAKDVKENAEAIFAGKALIPKGRVNPSL
ncbi:MAG: sugar phosphate isomerase/epimerase [Clostridia bacterium]|nr:sugar phosphate isomerase/epimerase [Clostridia bacterium]